MAPGVRSRRHRVRSLVSRCVTCVGIAFTHLLSSLLSCSSFVANIAIPLLILCQPVLSLSFRCSVFSVSFFSFRGLCPDLDVVSVVCVNDGETESYLVGCRMKRQDRIIRFLPRPTKGCLCIEKSTPRDIFLLQLPLLSLLLQLLSFHYNVPLYYLLPLSSPRSRTLIPFPQFLQRV